MRAHLRTLSRTLFAAVLLAGLARGASANATITIINLDNPGEGFNDATPAAPVGGNPGTTVGQQRLNAFQQAANIWGSILTSPVTIQVQAAFDPLTCDANSAVLGSAGPRFVEFGDPSFEFTNVWYHEALACKEAGVDLTQPGDPGLPRPGGDRPEGETGVSKGKGEAEEGLGAGHAAFPLERAGLLGAGFQVPGQQRQEQRPVIGVGRSSLHTPILGVTQPRTHLMLAHMPPGPLSQKLGEGVTNRGTGYRSPLSQQSLGEGPGVRAGSRPALADF